MIRRRWSVAAVCVLAGAQPVWAQEDVVDTSDDRVTIVEDFRNWRGRMGTHFEESDMGEYVNDHVTVAVEYRAYQSLDKGPPQDSRRTRHEVRLEVEFEQELADNIELFIETRLWLDDDEYATGVIESLEDDDRRRNIFNVTEAYLDVYFEDFDVRVGKQIVKWGKADVFNPTDQINPDDFSTLLDDEPIGVVAGKLNYYWGDWGLEVVVVPTFTPSRFPPSGTRFDLAPQNPFPPLLDPRDRADTPHDIQYGVRVNSTYEGWDFSLSWYDGVNHFPGIELVPASTFPFVALEPVYHRRRNIGADFATTFDRLGLHGEAAWFRTDGHRNDEYFQYVIGIDYTLTDVFRDHDIFAIIEYAGEYVITEQRKGVAAGALQRAFANTFAANIDYQFSEFLTFTYRMIYNFDRADNFLIEPQVEYEVNDHFTVTAGFDIIHGTSNDTIFGILAENDQFFFKGRYTF